jgi:2-polyprenyl-3-methyl-5-hydroxy-6-metoxy-1,4-benzoquinol methylase
LEFLIKKGGKFSNLDFVGKYLVKGKPDFLSGLYHTANLWESWSNMTDRIRRGKQKIINHINDRGDEWLSAFIESMHNRASIQAGPSIESIDLSDVKKILDVGGGSAAFSMAFVRAKTGITATVFDLPNVIPLTREYIKKEGFSGNIDVHAGNYVIDELPSGFDLVFLSAIVHSNSFEENENLIKKCAGALNPGGQIVVQDFIMDDDRTKPLSGALFALNMITGTDKGDTYTESEIQAWMKNAGFSDFRRIDQPFGTGQITGRKTIV